MFPFFRWNNSIISKHHGNCPSTFTYNVRIMIIFLIWYFLLFVSLMHCLSKSILIFFRIFVLFILPIFWNYNTIIPQIITYCISFIISYFRIMMILFTWYNTLHCHIHSFSLTILISIRIIIIFLIFILYLLFFNLLFFIFLNNFLFIITNTFPLTRNLNTLLFHYIFYTHTIYILNIRIMFKSIFRYFTIYNLYHSNSKSINILFFRFYNSTSYFLIIYSLLEPYLIYSFTFISYPIIRYWKLIIS